MMGQKPPNVWNWHLALDEGALSELGGSLVEHGKGQTLKVPSTLEEYYAAGGSLVAQGYLIPIEHLQSST
jgi:hypothetical protein